MHLLRLSHPVQKKKYQSERTSAVLGHLIFPLQFYNFSLDFIDAIGLVYVFEAWQSFCHEGVELECNNDSGFAILRILKFTKKVICLELILLSLNFAFFSLYFGLIYLSINSS